MASSAAASGVGGKSGAGRGLLLRVGAACAATRAAHALVFGGAALSANSARLTLGDVSLASDNALPKGFVHLSASPSAGQKDKIRADGVRDALLTDASAAFLLMHSSAPESASSLTASVELAEITSWMVRVATSTSTEALIAELDERLALRTYVVGHALSAADLAAWAMLVDKVAPEDRTAAFAHARFARRWFLHTLLLRDELRAAERLARSSVRSQWDDVMRLVKSQGSFELSLPGLEPGKVVTRFPPEPSGYLHIGHAKAALLNDFFARYFGGRLILRFDDTNPMKEKLEFEKSIVADLARLGVEPDEVSYTSDYFDELFEIATRFIEEDKAYVDMTPVEELREQRLRREANEFRLQSVARNLELWAEMRKGSDVGKQCVLRAKIDITSKNGAMRDPIMYRFVPDPPHHRTGSRYQLYPSYDFSCAIVDSLQGVTHALRSAEYADREDQYYWMCDAAHMRRPHMWDFARLNFMYTVMSKRKLKWFVESGLVDGWDDPRFPTVQGVRRRGMTIEALRAFILSQGSSKNATLMAWDKIWTVNKRVIDPVAPRYSAIDAARCVRVSVRNAGIDAGSFEARSIPKHKKNPDVGIKAVTFAPRLLVEEDDARAAAVGEIVTLMDWGNMRVVSCSWLDGAKSEDAQSASAEAASSMELEFLPENRDFKKTKKWTWVADLGSELVPVKLLKYDHLVTKAKIEDDEPIESILNPASKVETLCVADVNVKLIQKGEIVQLERRGYYICDAVHLRDSSPNTTALSSDKVLTLIEIPDGREKS